MACRFAPLLASAVVALAFPARAEFTGTRPLLIPTSQNRTVSAEANAENPANFDTDSDSDAALDFGPFIAAFVASAVVPTPGNPEASATVGGAHDSQFLSDGFLLEATTVGSADASGVDSDADGSARNYSTVSFLLTTECSYTVQGYLNAYDNGSGILGMHGPSGQVFGHLVAGPFEELDLDHSGVLPPGEYSMTVELDSHVFADESSMPFDFASAECSLTLSLVATESEIGASFCGPAVPNSSGAGGVMHVRGSATVADDNLVLEARSLPAGPNIGYFIMGTGTNTFTPPGSAGPICVAPGLRRFLPPVENTQELPGGFTRDVGTSGPVSGNITGGGTWSFQGWHRDSAAGTSNLTDAVSVSFL